MKNFEMNVSLQCSVCGNDQFSTVDESIIDMHDAPEDTLIRCSDCQRIMTKEQLVEENSHIINANMEDLKEQAIKEIEKELKKMFK
jgi:hypothetical protein